MYKIANHPNLNYCKINNLVGWFIFIVASLTYILTAEPTASLWDCGEFITTSVGLQVGHPPGAPLFMIISRFFAMFADPAHQAQMINYMSALASGFTILFLFWTITHLAAKLMMLKDEENSMANLVAVMGAGVVGALAYTFSDTFWFSAVEGEVYALSSLFTAVVFWAMLKWENVADEKYANRWIVLIAYLMGLSVGVHLLNLLAIPAIVFLYYFKKYTVTKWGIIKTGLLSLVILGFVNFMLIPGVIKVACWFELLFVNGMGASFNMGVIAYALCMIGGLTWGIRYTLKHKHVIVNTILTCFVVFMIGYSSYAMVVIRSISNPPIDENSPDNVFSLLSYLNRDQYGDTPLVFGQYYNAPLVEVNEGEANYYQNKKTGHYDIIGHKYDYKYDSRFTTIFPRMHNGQRPYYASEYKRWGGEPNGPVYNINGENLRVPSMGNNLRYFFSYQLGHMYWRYFMWNFSGRQNDTQGFGDIRYGNWITGIDFIDEFFYDNQQMLPDTEKSNPSRNSYWALPFILGLLGMFFQYSADKQGKRDFWVVMLLFFMTGIAIILFLNQAPREPRERDYAYAGSFYAYAIWIGLGVLWVWQMLLKATKSDKRLTMASVAFGLCLLAVPCRMAAQNWDDHNRSERYATLAHAKNYLNSCAPNAILFTYGDNDTFPLWYAQEVEGIRRDIRIVNLSLLSGSWYIDQIARKAYEAAPVPISLTNDQYHDGVRDFVFIDDKIKSANIKEVMSFVGSDSPQTKARKYDGDEVDYIPTRTLIVPVDKEKVKANGTVSANTPDSLILSQLEIKLKGNTLNKSQLMVLDILASANWERPIYFGVGMGNDSYMGLEKYFQLDGAAYKVVPVLTPVENQYSEIGRIETDTLYDIMMNRFDWGNIKNPKVYIDNFHRQTIGIMKYRNTFYRLSSELLAQGDTTRAVAALDKSLEELPLIQVTPEYPSPDYILVEYVRNYYQANQTVKGDSLFRAVFMANIQTIDYINSLSNAARNNSAMDYDARVSQQIIGQLLEIAREADRKELISELFGEGVLTQQVKKNN